MMMPNDANPPLLFGLAIAMLKHKIRCFPASTELDHIRGMPVMIPGQSDNFASLPQAIEECCRRPDGSGIMDKVTHDNYPARLIFRQQFLEAIFN